MTTEGCQMRCKSSSSISNTPFGIDRTSFSRLATVCRVRSIGALELWSTGPHQEYLRIPESVHVPELGASWTRSYP